MTLVARRVAAVLATVIPLAAPTALAAQPAAAAQAAAWTNPTCSTVSGPGGLTFTKDGGATFAPTTGVATPVSYTFGIAALDTANTLVSIREQSDSTGQDTVRTVYRSTNAGCNWTSLGTLVTEYFTRVTPAVGGRAYLHSPHAGAGLYRVTGTTLTRVGEPGTAGITGFGTDPANGLHVVAGNANGELYESFTGGSSWTRVGTVPAGLGEGGAYQIAVDPKNLSHAVIGTGTLGAFVTTTKGASWTRSSGLDLTPTGPGGVNVFSVAVSPVSSSVVYAVGLDLDQFDARIPSQGRHIYRSTNGGTTFSRVLDDSRPAVTLTNGTDLYPSIVSANEVYFTYGSSYNEYGTDVFRLNANYGTPTTKHSAVQGIHALAFNPTYPSTIYVGQAKISIPQQG